MARGLDDMGEEKGEEVAVKAFAFLAADDARIGRFLTLSGLPPDGLGSVVRTKTFLRGILEYVLQDETLLLTFSAESRLDPRTVAAAHRALAVGHAAPGA